MHSLKNFEECGYNGHPGEPDQYGTPERHAGPERDTGPTQLGHKLGKHLLPDPAEASCF